jgi:hypothetical protein
LVFSDYSRKDGLLRYKSRIWIGNNPTVHNQLISALHDTPVGGIQVCR